MQLLYIYRYTGVRSRPYISNTYQVHCSYATSTVLTQPLFLYLLGSLFVRLLQVDE